MTQEEILVAYWVAVLAYLAEYIVLYFGVVRACRLRKAPEADTALPNLTVLVCARDEENNIDRCLLSLSKLDYPSGKLELLVVDDKSTDRTPEILAEWKKKLPNLHVFRTGEEIANLRGKVNALAQGMDAAQGEIILITDADCQVSSGWAKSYAEYYSGKTGLVASVTLLNVNSFFGGIQSIDWAYLLGMAAAGANLNVPLSVIGNNMSIRRSTYEGVGGYRRIPFSVTEDHALFSAIWNLEGSQVRFPIDPDLLVMSEPTPDFKSWWRQKHRWVKGGQQLKAIGYIIFGIGMLGNLAMVSAMFFLPIASAVLIILAKWFGDFLIIAAVTQRTRMLSLLKYFPVYELYLALFVFSMPIMMLQKNVKWKGRVYGH